MTLEQGWADDGDTGEVWRENQAVRRTRNSRKTEQISRKHKTKLKQQDRDSTSAPTMLLNQ